jgi:hypothetical protein
MPSVIVPLKLGDEAPPDDAPPPADDDEDDDDLLDEHAASPDIASTPATAIIKDFFANIALASWLLGSANTLVQSIVMMIDLMWGVKQNQVSIRPRQGHILWSFK